MSSKPGSKKQLFTMFFFYIEILAETVLSLYYIQMETGLCCPDTIIDECAEKLKVCGHPIRLKLLCLIERQSACVTDLWQCLNQSQPVISQHLAVLKNRGIVSSTIVGNKRIYSIQDAFIRNIVQGFLPEEQSDPASNLIKEQA